MTKERSLGLDLQALGSFIRAQRKLAGFSLRQLADLTDVSNAYLSQLENGRHEPSIRVLKAVSSALNLSAESLLVYLGFGDEPPGDGEGAGMEGTRGATEIAIAMDPRLTDEQREALLSVYRSYVGDEPSGDDGTGAATDEVTDAG